MKEIDKKIYISGPMTLLNNYNLVEFKEKEKELRKKYTQVINPHNIHREKNKQIKYEEYIRQDILELLDCDCIYMLCGWENSKGARLEHHIASVLQLEIYYQEQNNV
ncbi:MAG: DUF4406 domain-containing protein [Promethearchaeia archaeon]